MRTFFHDVVILEKINENFKDYGELKLKIIILLISFSIFQDDRV